MKTKHIIYILPGLCLLSLTACMKSDLLNQSPQTAISDAQFWHSANDLKLYCNNFYQLMPSYRGWGNEGIYSVDNNSDNLIPGGYNANLNGEGLVPAGGGGWNYGSWSSIRDVNYFLANYSKVADPWNTISTYVGEAYFFRAWFYFDKLKQFGALPWVNKPLNVNDSSFLHAPRLARNVIVDSIISDLNNAISDLLPSGQAKPMRIYKELADGFKSRVCLYEGTWEKYHRNDPFGVPGQDGTQYLQLAAQAAQEVMNTGKFGLDNKNVYDGYWKLFNQTDYSNSKEVMLWRKYSVLDGVTTNWQRYLTAGANTGLSRSLVDDYLCTDGNPIAVSPLYQGDDSLMHVVASRDPRLRQTIYTPGDTIINSQPLLIFRAPVINQTGENRCVTGYQLYKGLNPDPSQSSTGDIGTDGLILMRYAEVLLNYAEAKAELGTISQADLDMSINLLRDRVGMPHLVLNAIVTDPNWKFPSLSPIINEVRRERRVELACEGFRLDDIFRWNAAGTLIAGWMPLGAKFNQWATVYPNLQPGKNIFVNAQGYIEPYLNVNTMQGGYHFNVNRDYLSPLPTQELTLNANMKQNPGW